MQVFRTRKDSSLLLLFSASHLVFAVSFIGREAVLCPDTCIEYDVVHKGFTNQLSSPWPLSSGNQQLHSHFYLPTALTYGTEGFLLFLEKIHCWRQKERE